MNPPFSASPKIRKRNNFATLNHVSSALQRLEKGGRLVTITANWFSPNSPDWSTYFKQFENRGCQVVFSAGIEGKAYSKHGTTIDTRLTVIEKYCSNQQRNVIDEVLTLTALAESIGLYVPPRSSEESSQSPKKAIEIPKIQTTSVVKGVFEDVIEIEYELINWDGSDKEIGDGIYEAYEPQAIRIKGAKPHPTPLVQSAAMAAIAPPKPTYKPMLPKRLLVEEILSSAQIETVIYAGNAHEEFLEGWFKVDETLDEISPTQEGEENAVRLRRGYFCGDGTGCGKGRQVSATILDNWLKGRHRAIWVSKNDSLLEDARRDWIALGGDENQIIPLSHFKQGEAISIKEGILFVTYGTLRTEGKQGKCSRVEQIAAWLGGEFDGVIVFDESHMMANAVSEKLERGVKKASMQGISGLRLQRALPQARVLYVSATGATQLQNLGYLERLGLWAVKDVPFKSRSEFLADVECGGVAALEVVARDLKALGLYTARSLSYEGVLYEVLEHSLTQEQISIYDRYAEAYQVIHNHIVEALEETNIVAPDGKSRNSNASSAAYSAFEGAKQRFFNHLITSMKCPTLIKSIQQDLDEGHAAVIQLVATDEALLDRRLAEIPTSQWDDVQIDLTPREYVFDYLMHAFPIQLHEVYADEEGHEYSRPVVDAEGNPVISQEALRQREELLETLALLPAVPSALDQIIQHFSHENVAEVTGRSKRIIKEIKAGQERLCVQNRSGMANISETNAFQQDCKRILVFSQAGGVGRSYHADLNASNQRLRRHYLLQGGWQADVAVQGLGRTNRSNQKQPPVFIVVTTDVKGEKRFTSTIARRLDSLGALTKGERKTGSQGLFREADNLESPYAKAALRQLYEAIYSGQISTCSVEKFQSVTGLKLTTREGNFKEDLPPIQQFLNRCLAMPIFLQRAIFGEFELRIASKIEAALEAGTYEVGVETLRAEGFRVLESKEIYQHSRTGATSYAVKIERLRKNKVLSLEEALNLCTLNSGTLYFNERSERVAVGMSTSSYVSDQGAIISRIRLVRPNSEEKVSSVAFARSEWRVATCEEFSCFWNRELAQVPEFNRDTFYLITGILLPIWKRLDSTRMKIYRLRTNDGERLLGRMIKPEVMEAIARGFGVDCTLTAQEIYDAVSKRDESVKLNSSLTLVSRMVAGQQRLEVLGFQGNAEFSWLKSLGAFAEMHSYKMRVFLPTTQDSVKIIKQIRQQA